MPHTARHKATHGRKGHSLKTVIKCDRQRALQPRFADTFLGAWPSPVQLQLQLSSQFRLSHSSQSNPVQLSSVSFCSSIHISHKSRASPLRLCTCSTLHSLLALALSLPSSVPSPPRRLCLHRDMRTSGVVVVVIIIDMAGGRFAQSLTWSPRPHIAYWISCSPLLRRRGRRPGSGNILC